jgi:uncharacterized membrane protein
MAKLEKLLSRWVSAGLINQQQANNIQQYENAHADNSWAMYGLLVLGAIIISIGVISLIAANWDHIPEAVKLFTDFAILSIMAIFIVRAFQEERELLFEILLLLFMLFCLASIGLISQIYNTGGELYQALMFWSFITFPVTVFARGKLVHMVIPFIWLGGFLFALVFTLYYSPLYIPYINYNVQAISMVVPLLCACLIQVGHRLSFADGYIRALRWWFFISGFIAIGMAELNHAFKYADQAVLTPYFPGYLLALLAAFGMIESANYNKPQKWVLLFALAIFLISFHIPLLMPDSSLIYAVFTILTLSSIAIFVASVEQRRLFNWLLFFVGVRFLILYFQALGGLAMTGFGLIISGLMIIGMVYYWNKYRSSIASWAERWLK